MSIAQTEVETAGGTKPFAGFEWLIAGRYLRARRKEGFISVIAGFSFLGITLGVATLIIVMAVMNGFRTELLNKILGINGHVVVQPLDGPLTDYAAVADRLAKVEDVKFTIPLVEGQALASSPAASSGVLVRGLRGQDLGKLQLVSRTIKDGTLEGFDEGGGILIGRRLADQLGVRAGDTVSLVTPRGAVTPMGVTPRIKGYQVQAIFEIGMSEYDSAFVFLPFEEAQAYFNREGDASSVEVYLNHPDLVQDAKPKLQAAAGRAVYMLDWRDRNKTFFSALEVERNVMFLILTLIVLVAALNIISGLIMLVKDKGRDIAILRTMGATRGSVMRIFLITGASIGVIGTLAGFALGMIVCWNVESIRAFLAYLTGTELFSPEVYFLSKLPADPNARETATVVLTALVLSVVATLYPSWRAAKLDPVEALRYE